MTRDTLIALFLMGKLVAALRANDHDTFKRPRPIQNMADWRVAKPRGAIDGGIAALLILTIFDYVRASQLDVQSVYAIRTILNNILLGEYKC